MPTTDPRVDDYIGVVGRVRQADPRPHPTNSFIRHFPRSTETMKWSFPHFEYKGMLCSHGVIQGALRVRLLEEPLEADALTGEKTAMGSFGRITSLNDLPSRQGNEST